MSSGFDVVSSGWGIAIFSEGGITLIFWRREKQTTIAKPKYLTTIVDPIFKQ